MRRKFHKPILLCAAVLLVSGCSRPDKNWSEAQYEQVRDELMKLAETWRSTRPRMGEVVKPYNVKLVLDTEVPALWIERDGKVQPEEKVTLPKGMNWSVEYVTPKGRTFLSSPVVLKQRGDTSKINIAQEVVYVEGWFPGTTQGMHFSIRHSGTSCGMHKPTRSMISLKEPKPQPDSINESFLSSPQELTEQKEANNE